jgi:hypothetical protein
MLILYTENSCPRTLKIMAKNLNEIAKLYVHEFGFWTRYSPHPLSVNYKTLFFLGRGGGGTDLCLLLSYCTKVYYILFYQLLGNTFFRVLVNILKLLITDMFWHFAVAKGSNMQKSILDAVRYLHFQNLFFALSYKFSIVNYIKLLQENDFLVATSHFKNLMNSTVKVVKCAVKHLLKTGFMLFQNRSVCSCCHVTKFLKSLPRRKGLFVHALLISIQT